MPDAPLKLDPARFRAVAIGSSTGAPNLVQKIIAGLPADLPVPILIAQHLPPKFTADMAVSMDRRSALTVVEAQNGLPVLPGTVYLGKGRMHMRIARESGQRAVIRVSEEPAELVYKPSVDELFDACAEVYGRGTLGIVMTGIGRDGLVGAKRLVEIGGTIVTQTKASCAVYGMPRACDDAGISSASLDPDQIRELIHQLSPSYGSGNPALTQGLSA